MTPRQAYEELLQDYNNKYFRHVSPVSSIPKPKRLSEQEVLDRQEVIKNTPEYAFRYADSVLHGRWKDAEPSIKKDGYYAALYAMNVMRKRWKRAEQYIVKNAKAAAEYADKVIRKGRWTEAEPEILKSDPICIFEYYSSCKRWDPNSFSDWPEAESRLAENLSVFARYVAKSGKRNIHFEETMLKESDNKSAAKYIFDYCCGVLKSRWEQAEPILFKNPEYAAKYCSKFGVLLPEDQHNQVMTEIAFNMASAHKKAYFNKIAKEKANAQKYIKKLIENKIITTDTPVSELLK